MHTPLQVTSDSRDHIANAKGKEIKRSKEETRTICLLFINEFMKDEQAKREIIDDYQKETFWQRVGLKKDNKELPLFALGNERVNEVHQKLRETIDAS